MTRGRPSTSAGKGKGIKGSKKGITPPRNSDSEPENQSPQQSQQPNNSDSDSEMAETSILPTRRTSPRQVTTGELRGAIEAIPVTEDKGKEPRKKRPSVTISDAQEAAALDFLKSNPVLYDRSMREYKDVPTREKLWEQLANQLNTKRYPMQTDDIKKWFESQRTIYGKSSRMMAGQSGKRLSDRQKWVIIQFGFLAGHIYRQTAAKDSPVKDVIVPIIVPETASRCVDSDSDDAQAGTSTRSEKRRRVASPPDTVERLLRPDPRRAFCEFIAASVKDIDESLWDNYAQEAFSVLTDYKRRTRALLLPPPPVPQPRLHVTRPARTSTPNFLQQPQPGGFNQYSATAIQHLHHLQVPARPSGSTGKPSPPQDVPARTAQPVVPGGKSGTAAHNTSAGSIGMLVAEYNESDVPESIAQMKTPTRLEEEEKDDQ